MTEIRGSFDARGRRFAVVAASFNEIVVSKLLEGAMSCLRSHGIADEDVYVAWVPERSRSRWWRGGWPLRPGTTP